MQIKFVETSAAGLRWMKHYYRQRPELNREKAFNQGLRDKYGL
jgi:hypothetical protein